MPKKINVKGPIISNDDKWIYDWLDMDATCPSDISAMVEDAGNEGLLVNINSPGGDVYSASEIYTELKAHQGDVEVRIVGVAASAASVIAMAGKTVKVAPTAQIMIHNAGTVVRGDHRVMDKASDYLKKVNQSISNAYHLKTGLAEEDLLSLMAEETWMTAEEAKEKGFADEIMFEEEGLRAVASGAGALPVSAIDKIRANMMKQPEAVTADDVKNMFEKYREEIVNEVKNKIETNQELNHEPAAPKQNMATLFLNVKGE